MRSIFEDKANRKALGMDKEDKIYKIHIREPGTIVTKDEDTFYKLKSVLLYNKINSETETIIN